jgi:signal transduction histidine kinase
MSRREALIGRVRQVDPSTVDRFLALAFAVALEAEIAIADRFSSANLLTQASVVATTLSIVGRRRSPVAATALAMGAAVVQGAQDGAPLSEPLGASMIAAWACVWSAARHFDRPIAWGSLAVALGGFLALSALPPTSGLVFVVGDALWASGITALTWGVGRAFRSRWLRASALEDRADRLRGEQEERARLAVADERSRIARELHDIVAHHVSTMVVQAGAGRRVIERDPQRAGGAFASIEGAGRQALVELRRLLGILRTDSDGLALAPQPSIEQLGGLVESVRGSGLSVELVVRGDPRPLPPGIDVSAYRIVQEGLTNTIKHAGKAKAEVIVEYGERDLDLRVVDDGRGGAGGDGDGRPGHGLVGMRERVTLYGGTLETGARSGGGYSIHARLPIEPRPS